MLTVLHLIVLLYFSLFNCLSSDAFVLRTTNVKLGESLLYVQAVWRHGDRAPHQLPYPNDPNDENSWPRGWAQLTNIGMKQLYELGLFFRKRYDKYIEEFNRKEIQILSSRSDRAIVSAQAMLRGFFPVNDIFKQWLKGEQWQPISFRIESAERNAPLLHSTLHFCSRYNQLMTNEMEVVTETMMHNYDDVVDFLANATGINEGLNFGRIAALYDITREMAHQLPQPEWVYRKWPQFHNMSTVDIITEFKRISQISRYNTFEKARFKGGLLLGEILHRFQNVSDGTTVEAQKMFLYSAHDSTLLSLQHALNISNGLLVPYSACLIMELYRTEENEKIVKIFYKNETENTEAYEVFVPGCSTPCKLDQLIKLSSPTILDTVDDLNQACENKRIDDNAGSNKTFNNAARHHNVTVMSSISIIFIFLYLLSVNY